MTDLNYMDNFLAWLESTTPEERLGRKPACPTTTGTEDATMTEATTIPGPLEVIISASRNAAAMLRDPGAFAAVIDRALAAAGYTITATAELERLQEIEAEQSGRFRVKEIIKPDREKDFYVGWSHTCEMPAMAGTRAEFIAEGCPPSRLRRADERGTSMRDDFGCAWDHGGLIAEQRGFLPRARIGAYAVAYLEGRTGEAFDLLEPFDGETEVRRA